MTRITNSMTTRLVLADLQSVAARLARTQHKLSSGKELERPSDDPFETSRALALRAELADNRQYQRNVQEAQAWQEVTDGALGAIGDLTQRARELLLQGANDTIGQSGRDSIAAELEQLVDSIKSQANVSYAGRYVFGGSITTGQPPYALGASDVYSGNSEAITREIGPGVRVDVNVTGIDAIGGETGGTPTGLLKTLRDAITRLQSGTPADLEVLRTTDLQELDDAQDNLLSLRASVGAVGARLEVAGNRLEQLEGNAMELLSNTEDADMAKTIIDYSTQQAVYQSALKAGAGLLQPSLLDFLR